MTDHLPFLERRRLEVDELCREGTDEKMLCFRTKEALQFLERAMALADQEPPLPLANRGLVAYRLAHVQMRCADGLHDLEEVQALFQTAARSGALAPWPGSFGPTPLAGRVSPTRFVSSPARR